MTFDELVEEWKKDATIHPAALDSICLQAPLVQGKWFNFLCRERGRLTQLKFELDGLKQWKRDYYLGDMPPEELSAKGLTAFARIIPKCEVDALVNVDKDVVELLKKIAVVQIKVEFIDLCVQSLNKRNFDIKNAIDFLKIKNGIV
jgi:hypothetical protein